MPIDVTVSEDGAYINLIIFSKKAEGYMDVCFVVLARFMNNSGAHELVCFQDAEGGIEMDVAFTYYPALADECAVRKIDTGIYQLTLPRKMVDGKELVEAKVIGAGGVVLKKIVLNHS